MIGAREIRPDLCVIGGGSGGLSVAAGAAQMGARVVLIEPRVIDGAMGGDCLHFGCVPSKALIAAARQLHQMRVAAPFGIRCADPALDDAALYRHVRQAIETIAPHDSVERFEQLGVQVIQAPARFLGPDRVAAGDAVIAARWFVLATGSRPAIPTDIPGVTDAPFLTNETLFGRTRLPPALVILGGGAIALEMAQAHARLGSRVTVIARSTLLSREEPALVAPLRAHLIADGVTVHERAAVAMVAHGPDGVTVHLADGTQVDGSDLLIATGRQPAVEGLGLEAAGIAYGLGGIAGGIAVDARLRTSNRRVFAIGDCIGGQGTTHRAGYHAGIVIRNILFRLPAKAHPDSLPVAVYTDPELARIGPTSAELDRQGIAHTVAEWPLARNDRAVAERQPAGLVRALVGVGRRKGRILGCSILAPHAADLLAPWQMAMAKGGKIGDLAALTLPYPTLGEASKRAAGNYFTPVLYSDRTRRIVRWLVRL